jgi:hypothetical protein
MVEILVVFVVIISLAAVTMSITGAIKSKARASKHLSDIRQSGTILLGKASETNGRCSYFAGGAGSFEYRPYLIVKADMGIEGNNLCEIMHWDTTKLPPSVGNAHWSCRGVNYTTVTHADGTKTSWTQESIKNSDGTTANVRSISLASVARPASYPLLIDSSNESGAEIFRVGVNDNEGVGMRDSGKASAFMFDGSAGSLDKADLKKAGFTKAYDNSVKPPKSIKL